MSAYALPAAVLIAGMTLAPPAWCAPKAVKCSKACKTATTRTLGAPLPPRHIVLDAPAAPSALARDVATLKAARLASTQ